MRELWKRFSRVLVSFVGFHCCLGFYVTPLQNFQHSWNIALIIGIQDFAENLVSNSLEI